MDYSTINNVGTGSHFWFTMLAIALTVLFIGVPIYKIVKMSITDSDESFEMFAWLMRVKPMLVWFVIGLGLSIVLWTACWPG